MSRPRIRHVWVRPAYGVGQAKPGLVIAWRKLEKQASPPQWQARVVVFDERDETVTISWVYASELEPVGSALPGARKPGFAAYGQVLG
jgi:hypothetical protein